MIIRDSTIGGEPNHILYVPKDFVRAGFQGKVTLLAGSAVPTVLVIPHPDARPEQVVSSLLGLAKEVIDDSKRRLLFTLSRFTEELHPMEAE